MKKKGNTEDIFYKKNYHKYDNTLNKCSNYFNVSKIKKLYNTENNSIYEQIFDTCHEKNVLKKRKREIYRKNSPSPYINKNEINEKTSNINKNHISSPLSSYSPLCDLYYQKFKNNNEKKNMNLKKKIKSNQEFYFDNNNFDKTPKKSIIDNINVEEKSFIKINSGNYNLDGKNKNTLIKSNSLNKYDFIRFICSPNKRRSNEKNTTVENEGLSFTNVVNEKKENFNKNLHNHISILNRGKSDLEKNIINNNINIDNIITGGDKDNTGKNEGIKNVDLKETSYKLIEPYDSCSINKLSKNFFINNKKFFINDFNEDKLTNNFCNDNSFTKENMNDKNYFINSNYENYNKKKVSEDGSVKTSHTGCDLRSFNKDSNEDTRNYTFDKDIYDNTCHDENNYLKDIDSYVKRNYKIWKSLYSYLDVSYNCSKEDIKKSYKEKIKVHHPDKGGSINKFLELKLSYDILINDKKRKLYDKYGNSILELLISEKFNDYNISSDEKNEEEVIDEECSKIYDLFVLKYKNVSYLHNLCDLKINSSQYNEFQKLIFQFFNMENNIFKNIFFIYPIFSPYISPFSKIKKKKNSEDFNTYIDEIISENSCNTTENSPLNCNLTHEIKTFGISKKKNIVNIFNNLNAEFEFFFKNYVMHKIELSEVDKKKYNKSYFVDGNEHKTIFKENKDSFFKKNTFISPISDHHYINYNDIRRNKNPYESTASDFFKDIQLSPIAYRIISGDNKEHVDHFYKWFEFFFEDSINEHTNKEGIVIINEDDTNKEVIMNMHKEGKNKNSDSLNVLQRIMEKENEQNLKEGKHINEIKEELSTKNESIKKIEKNLNIYENAKKIEEKEYNKYFNNLNNITQNINLLTTDLNGKKKHEKKICKSFDMYNKNIIINNYNSSINNTNKISEFPNSLNNSLKKNYDISNNSLNLLPEKNYNKSFDNVLNIEEKYGFNLFKKSEHKINDMTHDFNYIYVGNSINKKKKFILFIKDDSIKKFLKIKLLINKIKKKSNLKHISLFENEIDKNMKNIEYILLLITNKEDLIPLNDFYLLDKNKYLEDYYCIPLYIKKNNIIRPYFYHFKWIVYTLQSLVFFNLYFQKVNKYMCVFPFFNYKYNYFKKYFKKDKEESNYDKVHSQYIFFQHYIIKNKYKYLKYFPHYILLYLKDVVSLNENDHNHLQINLSPIFVLTPNKLF